MLWVRVRATGMSYNPDLLVPLRVEKCLVWEVVQLIDLIFYQFQVHQCLGLTFMFSKDFFKTFLQSLETEWLYSRFWFQFPL